MQSHLDRTLQYFSGTSQLNSFKDLKRGIERECLRIGAGHELSRAPHPVSLGSALKHPWITTDYSEAQLEFRTPVLGNVDEMLDFLRWMHQFACLGIGQERLWPFSIPCGIQDVENIPLAVYGKSNSGRMKHIYRKGLKLRYGSLMQIISGVHYNFSMPMDFWAPFQSYCGDKSPQQDFVSVSYMGMIRNIHRFGWLVPYLFGASPLLCQSFIHENNKNHPLEQWDHKGTLYGKYATSLRMSDLGYQNKAQAVLNINYNELEQYISALRAAIRTPDPDWLKLGTKNKKGDYIQLSTGVLQIENEYYGTVRPKRVVKSGESPTCGLKRRGIEYIELRSLDINPFSPFGVDKSQALFLDVFLFYCLLKQSPFFEVDGLKVCRKNFQLVVNEGRRPGLTLQSTLPRTLIGWAGELFDEMSGVAELLDRASETHDYSSNLKALKEFILDTEQTFSARFIRELNISGLSFLEYGHAVAEKHHSALMQTGPKLPSDVRKDFEQKAAGSLAAQAELEKNDSKNFEDFLADYFNN